jgi:hypothetical protein
LTERVPSISLVADPVELHRDTDLTSITCDATANAGIAIREIRR